MVVSLQHHCIRAADLVINLRYPFNNLLVTRHRSKCFTCVTLKVKAIIKRSQFSSDESVFDSLIFSMDLLDHRPSPN